MFLVDEDSEGEDVEDEGGHDSRDQRVGVNNSSFYQHAVITEGLQAGGKVGEGDYPVMQQAGIHIQFTGCP